MKNRERVKEGSLNCFKKQVKRKKMQAILKKVSQK